MLGNQGACIIAKSYEAKAAGITTGMPIWKALPVCPQAVYIKRDFHWYETLSRKMLAIVHEVSPRVEFYSIDEQFFVAQESTLAAAERLQQTLLTRVGVPVSVWHRPHQDARQNHQRCRQAFGHGIVLDERDRQQLLRGRPVTDITGIAKRSAAKLASTASPLAINSPLPTEHSSAGS